ncbi:Hypothetical predicted protein, partial [Olea europaea subsp. europaea]
QPREGTKKNREIGGGEKTRGRQCGRGGRTHTRWGVFLFLFVRLLGNGDGGSVEVDLGCGVVWRKDDLCGLMGGE